MALPQKQSNGVSVHSVQNGDVLPQWKSSVPESLEGLTINDQLNNVDIKVYKFRWVILVLFVFHSMSNAFQWIQYSIITNIVAEYYNVSTFAIDWTSMIYMVVYIPLIFPASWFLDHYGLRKAVLIGSFGTCLGAWIKCLSVSPDRFAVTFVGQTICAVSQIFILGIPPHLAALWFGSKQVSTACAIGVFGNQLGVALGFVVPPEMVSGDPDNVGHNLSILFYMVAGVTSVIFIVIVIVFRNAPDKPPSLAAAQAQEEPENYFKSILSLGRNWNYMLLLTTYGINTGVFYAVSTLLNQVVISHFPGQEQHAGRIGLTIVLSGMVGSIVCGVWLDKTHKFKETTFLLYLLSLVGMIGYTFNFYALRIWVVYLIAALLGFFMTGYLPLGFEFAAEITYPEPEGTSSGLLNASAQLFGIVFTMGAGALLTSTNDLYSNIFLCVVLLAGTIMTGFIKPKLLRLEAQAGAGTTEH